MSKPSRTPRRAILCLCASLFACAHLVRGEDRPNIVVIYADNQAGGVTGFEGNREIRTPHLDKLAEQSAWFTRCYVPTPQCAPSRACLLTGQYPHTNGVTTDGLPLSPMADTFTARLKKAGYACGVVGKWDLGEKPDHAVGFGFDAYTALSAQPGTPEGWADADVWVQGKAGKADKYLTDWETDRAIDFVEKRKEGPFFLWLSYHAPHEPLAYPPGMEQTYPPVSLALPATLDASTTPKPSVVERMPMTRRFKDLRERQREIREARSMYYAMITRMDENIGRLLGRLDELKLAERTIVVFTSDNGWVIGERQMFSEGPVFYDEMIRMPLLVRYPRLTKPASRIDRVVSPVDLAPTFLELAGLEPPMGMQGRSLVAVIHDPATTAHADERFLEFHKQYDYRPVPVRLATAIRVPPARSETMPATSPAPPMRPDVEHGFDDPRGLHSELPGSMPARHPGAASMPGNIQTRPGLHDSRQRNPSNADRSAHGNGLATRPFGPASPRGGGHMPSTRPGLASRPGMTPPLGRMPVPAPAVQTPSPAPAPQPPVPVPQPLQYFMCPVRGIVTLNYKFIDYLQDSDILTDLRRDPQELRNRAQEPGWPQGVHPEYVGVLRVLRERLEQWKKQTRDVPAMN